MRKGQFALEFLFTYGWAFLVLGVTVAAIYAFGWFDIGAVLPQRCDFFGQVECTDYYADAAAGEIQVTLLNDFSADLVVRDFNATDGRDLECTDPPQIPNTGDWPLGTDIMLNLSNCAGASFYSGGRINAKLAVRYRHEDCSSELCEHTSYGTLDVKVN